MTGLFNSKYYKFYFIVLGVLLLLPSFAHAQAKGSLRGLLIDATSGSPLPFGNIVISELNSGSSSDDKGYFIIAGIPANRSYSVQVSYVGYESQKTAVYIAENRITEIVFKLVPYPIEMQTVEKIGEREGTGNETDIGLTRLAAQDLERLPQGVETDLMRSLQYLPGISTVGDMSANYYVRGGESNQNLVVLDGVTVYNPFHAMGLFSSIDPEIIRSVEFYKGGFPVEYGGRLSSVMKIVSKEGNRFKFSGQASASFLSGKASVEGPIPHGSFFAAGRKSYSTNVLKTMMNGRNLPFDFYDLSFKVFYQNNAQGFIDDSKFTLHGFFSGDKLINDNPFQEDFKWSNNIIGFKRFQLYDIPMYSEISISASRYSAEVIPKLSGTRPKRNKVEELTARSDFTYVYDTKDELGLGLLFTGLRTDLYQVNGRGIEINLHDFGGNISIYSKYKFLRWEKIGLDFGTRLNLEAFKRGGDFYFEPRINATYRFSPYFALKTSWGLFQQGITTIYDEREVVSIFEPWYIIPVYISPARAIHYNIGFDIELSDEIMIDAEGYYKVLQHLPTLNPDKRFRTDPDLVEGSGTSYGWEFLIKYIKDPFYFTSSYSLSWAYKTVNDWKYYPRYDSRHSVKIVLDINLGKGWQASSAWIYNTGYPFTPTNGYYHRLNSQDLTQWDIFESYNPYLILGDRNVNRLPDYHRLDFTFSKSLQIFSVKFKIEINVLNVYNRSNLFYFDRQNGERVNMLPRLTTAGVRLEL